MSELLEQKIAEAIRNPTNVGELAAADAMGTAGSPGCGDMLRIWLKFKENDGGEKVIDQATFQSFGCETAIAVASLATEMLRGKTIEQAQNLSGADLSGPLGPLPPMKIHCASLVEEALKQALSGGAQRDPSQTVKLVGDQEHLLGKIQEQRGSKATIKFI
ncbi:MAG: iron-sulfur cluster assembly scaffold protein [Blastochloris sp.]|jgi:NifU-like protein involved in Fe-S cluster formation|nr:iron-sulfur cluster assembly scaffold protein [Blastochloris sp.]